jgi:hypothetical protein
MAAHRFGTLGDGRFVADYPNNHGRLTRVRSGDRGTNAVAYIVAAEDADTAIAIIRSVTDWNAAIEDVGRVSDALIRSLGLSSGGFVRIAG